MRKQLYYHHPYGSPHSPPLDPHTYRRFRVVEASCFLSSFASDRSHMRKEDGEWLSPPPSYDPIKGDKAEVDMNLDDYLNLRVQGEGKGRLMTLDEMVSFVRPGMLDR